MNNVYTCIGKSANIPFCPKFSEFSLYSIEELCYYFIERCYVIQEDIASMELVLWIKNECGLPELASKLEQDVRKRVSTALIVASILEYTGIYSAEQIKKTERVIREQSMLPPFERWKERADYYYKMGRFRQAYEIYCYLLKQTKEEDDEKKAILYYNIASIYALDFEFENACRYYEKSYGIKPLKQTRVAFLMAKKFQMNEYSYGLYMRENPQWEEEFEEVQSQSSQIDQMWEESRTKEVYEEVCQDKSKERELIKNLKKDYRRQTYLNQ